jgi:aspartate kinase
MGLDEDIENNFDGINQEAIQLINNFQNQDKDFYYDQFVSLGELLSSQIVYGAILQTKKKVLWVDAAKLIITDQRYRMANVKWAKTEQRISEFMTVNHGYQYIVTQGFVAGETQGSKTTLGREGSDYSAAIFSYCMPASRMTIWKDVEGVLTGDPRLFTDVELIPYMSYKEAIEMTYYGAQVIHPKTIQPIQKKDISLYVKSFYAPNKPGTLINLTGVTSYPPMIVVTKNQYLLHIASRDYSFIAESHLSKIFKQINEARIRINLMNNSAISFRICVSAEKHRLEALINELEHDFIVKIQDKVELITVRHYTESKINELKIEKDIIFEEIHDVTYQMIVRV